MRNHYLVGSAKTKITPNKSMPMAGYINREHHAAGVLDDLYARALYIESPLNGSILIVSLDLIRIDNSLYDEIRHVLEKEYGLNPDTIHVTATHTHSGPEISTEVWNTKSLSDKEKELVMEYRGFLIKKITRVVGQALKNTSPSKIYVGSSEIIGVASNRIDPNAPIDNEAVILVAKNLDGEIKAVIVNYACHPTILGPSNNYYSGDLAGMISRNIEEEHDTICLYLNGAAGNVSTRYTRKSQSYDEVIRLANQITSSINNKICEGLEEIPVSTIITKWFSDIIKVRKPASEEELRKMEEFLRKKLDEAITKGYNEAVLRGIKSDLAAVLIAKERRSFLEKNRFIELKIATTRIGGHLLLVFFPGEAFIEYQINAKKYSKTKYTMFIGYANGYLGYVPYEANSPKPVSYEEVVSVIDPSEYDKINVLIKKAIENITKDLIISSKVRGA